jgi:hypothetical protein
MLGRFRIVRCITMKGEGRVEFVCKWQEAFGQSRIVVLQELFVDVMGPVAGARAGRGERLDQHARARTPDFTSAMQNAAALGGGEDLVRTFWKVAEKMIVMPAVYRTIDALAGRLEMLPVTSASQAQAIMEEAWVKSGGGDGYPPIVGLGTFWRDAFGVDD